MALVKVNWLNAAVLNDVTAAETVTGLSKFTFQTRTTGTQVSFAVYAEGSIDGSTWDALTVISDQLHVYRADFANGVDASSSGRFVQYVRLRVSTLTGGGSPTVTVSMLAL